MPTPIKLGGLIVDQEDPCAMKIALEAIRMRSISGENVEEISIQSPATRETVRFSPSDRVRLEAEIQKYDRLCREKNGLPRSGGGRRMFRY